MHTYRREIGKTALLALPFIANQLLQMSVVTIDSIMAGADGELTLAAVAQGVILWDLVVIVTIGVMMPMSAMIAKAHAARHRRQINTLMKQALWLAALLAVFGVLFMWFVPQLMVWIGVEPSIIAPASDYLRITAWTLPFIAFYLPIRFLNEGIGNPKIVMYITASSLPINIIGNYLLLNGVWGLPKMGASGIAIATLVAEIYICVAGWYYLSHSKKLRAYRLNIRLIKPDVVVLKHYLRIGLPNAVTMLMEIGMFACVVLLSGRLGVVAAAANQIVFNYTANVFMIPLGISMALTTRVGRAVGEGDWQAVKTIGRSGIVFGAMVMCVAMVTILSVRSTFVRLYGVDDTVAQLAAGALILAAVSQIFDGVQVCAAGALRGLEDTRSPMRYAMLGYWGLAMPIGILAAFAFGMGIYGLWMGLIVGLVITAGLCARRFWCAVA